MAKIIAKELNGDIALNGPGYRIDFGDDMILWFDVFCDDYGNITGDWNKCIFHTNNEADMREKAFQEACNDEIGAYNFATAFDLATREYEADLQGAKASV